MSTLEKATTEAIQRVAEGMDVEKLAWMFGRTTPENPFHRTIVWETLEERLPRSALARVRFQVGELEPNSWTPWHLHNGPSYHLVLQGTVVVERAMKEPDRPGSAAVYDYVERARAGEACTEPVGIPHRAGNPDPTTKLLAITFHAVDADRHHIVPVFGEPSGVVEPQ